MKRYHIMIPFLLFFLICSSCSKSKLPESGSASNTVWQEQYDLGVHYLSEGNYQEAIIAFTAAIEIDPNLPNAYLDRAQAYLAIGEEQSAMNDVKSAVLHMDDSSLFVDHLVELGQKFMDKGQFFETLVVNAPESLAVKVIQGIKEGVLGEELNGYETRRVTELPFISFAEGEFQAYPGSTSGFISGCVEDINCDGVKEIVSAWSDGGRIYIIQSQYTNDGKIVEIKSDPLYNLSYSSNAQIVLYHRSNTDQWLIGVADFYYVTYTGASGFECSLYQFVEDELRTNQKWSWSSYMPDAEYEYELICRMLRSVQWPISDEVFFEANYEGVDKLIYLAKTETTTEANGEGWDNVTYMQRFVSKRELDELSDCKHEIVGHHAGEQHNPIWYIGQPLSQLTAEMGLDYIYGSYEGGYYYSYGNTAYFYDDDCRISLIMTSDINDLGDGLSGSMTYKEIMSVTTDAANITEPTTVYNAMDDMWEYNCSLTYKGHRYVYTWIDDPVDSNSVEVWVY